MADSSADLSRGPVLLSFSLATASFALATTFVRFYVRRGIHGGLGADDYTSGAATVIALIGTIFGILEGTAAEPVAALQFYVIGQPWYLASATLSKISICLFFMSLLRRARQWRILLAGLIVIMAVINSAFALAVYLQCRPLEKVWEPSVAGSCSDPNIQANFGYAQGAFSVFSWVFLALFPMLIIRDISRGGEPTWPFYATSALSVVSGIFVIVRTAQTSQTTGTDIYTIHFFYASLMANLEQNISLTSSNLLTLGPLFTSSTTTATTTTTTTSTSGTSRHRRRRRRDPYSSSSSTGTSRSRKPKPRTNGSTLASIPSSSRAGSSRSINRPDTRDSSRASLHRAISTDVEDHNDNNTGERAGGEIERKRTTTLIIEGPGSRAGGNNINNNNHRGGSNGNGDLEAGVGIPGGYEMMSDDDGNDHDDDDGYSSDEDGYGSAGSDDIDLEAWPRGIIKTVSVEVVEEVNEEYVAAVAAAAAAAGNGNNAQGGGEGSSSKVVVGAAVVAGGSKKGIGRNSVSIVPGGGSGGVGGRQPRVAPPIDNADRVSGGSVIEQDWETMLRAGPPR